MALDDLTSKLDKQGRMPAVKMEIEPLDTNGRFNRGNPFTIDRFISYSFSSNILIPVDTFAFSFRPEAPKKEDRSSYYDRIVMEGDAVQLTVGGVALATGYVDARDSDTDISTGVTLTVHGRDLMGMMEDNDAVNPDASILWFNSCTIKNVMEALIKNTRILSFETRDVDEKHKDFFGTVPGESKLAALQRYLDPLNALAWMNAGGGVVIGKPAFSSPAVGTLGVRIFDRTSNVLNFRVKRASGTIHNVILAIWTGNESVQTISKKQAKPNNAEGPARLYKAGHRLYRTIVTSAPSGDVKDAAELNRFIGSDDYMSALAKKEMARENINEMIVTCSVPGHLNEQGDPFMPDQCYNIIHDAEGIDEKMYLFGVEYALSEDSGQVTHLSFCKLNTIVSDGKT